MYIYGGISDTTNMLLQEKHTIIPKLNPNICALCWTPPKITKYRQTHPAVPI